MNYKVHQFCKIHYNNPKCNYSVRLILKAYLMGNDEIKTLLEIPIDKIMRNKSKYMSE